MAVVNSPYAIAQDTVLTGLLWILMAPAVAGSAAARDVQTRMHPLIYAAPISKADYLGGRFLAAFVLNALILLAVPLGILAAVYLPGREPELVGPLRPAVYLSSYGVLALPTAFTFTAVQFSLAALKRRAIVSYLGTVLFFVTVGATAGLVLNVLQMPTLGTAAGSHMPHHRPCPHVGHIDTARKEHRSDRTGKLDTRESTPMDRRRFGHTRIHLCPLSPRSPGSVMRRISVPQVRRKFGFATHARQTCAIAGTAFGTIAKSAAGLVALAVAMLVVLLAPALMALRGVPLLPRTAQVLTVLTAPVADNPRLPWVLIPLLIVFYAGELVWRERDAGLSEIADATPVPEWALFLGKFLGLSLVLVALMALVATAGVLGQMRMGYFDFEIGLYLRILFGLQLIDYILFALLVFVVHAVVNQKHVGYLVALIAYGVIVFPSTFGLEHHLLIYGSGPRWTYSDIRGFGPSLGPWLWFKLYWAAWAVLLAVAGRLLWARGAERSLWSRLQVARRRFTRATAGVAAMAVALIVTLGGFIFYNTNSLNRYRTASEETERRAGYERRYGKYAGVAHPTLASTNLRVEIYPDRREAEIRGAYVLANTSSAAIDSIHVTTVPGVETGAVSVDRPASPVLVDDDLGYRIYALEKPLQPGDSLHLNFEVHVAPHGFRNNGADAFVVQNGSHFTNRDWLPAIGYQRNRELDGAGVRRQYGLARRPAVPSLDDAEARRIRVGGDPITFEAIVGTSGDQVAVAPGALRRTWTEGGRRYFHYLTDVPINNQYGVFSARYALHEEQWNRLRRAQGRPSRFRSSITLGMPGIWAAWWRAYAPRSITTPGSLVPTHTAISG